MTMFLRKNLYLFFSAVLLLAAVVPAYSRIFPMGGSVWCLRKNGLIGYITLNQGLLSQIKEVKEGHYDLAASSDGQLQQFAAEVIQPYLNRKLAVTVNGRNCPVKVDKLLKDGFKYTIWLSVDNVGSSAPGNSLKIEYRLLFDETANTHVNVAYLYKSEATGSELQKVFDYSSAQDRHDFDAGSPVWEYFVK